MEDKSSFLFSQSGKEIPIERLKSVPGAIRCVACEGKKQRKELSSVREEFSAAYKKISPAFFEKSEVFLKEARTAWKHAVEKILSEEAGYSVLSVSRRGGQAHRRNAPAIRDISRILLPRGKEILSAYAALFIFSVTSRRSSSLESKRNPRNTNFPEPESRAESPRSFFGARTTTNFTFRE